MTDVEAWAEASGDTTLSLEAMDGLIKDYRDKRATYEKAKAESSQLYKQVEEVEVKVIAALKAANKKSYKVDGVGTFSVVYKTVVTVPSTIERRRELFGYIKGEHGQDVLDKMTTINYQTLNSFFNQELERKDDPAFLMPGLDAPTTREEGRFTGRS